MKQEKVKIRTLNDDLNKIMAVLASTSGDLTKLESMNNYQAIRRVTFTLRRLRKCELKLFEDKLKEIRKMIEKKELV
jgi:hypothetical protein